jgi:hypothetical protein
MQTWIFVVAATLLVIPLAWIAVRSRETRFDIEPVSRHWLEEQKRMSGEA